MQGERREGWTPPGTWGPEVSLAGLTFRTQETSQQSTYSLPIQDQQQDLDIPSAGLEETGGHSQGPGPGLPICPHLHLLHASGPQSRKLYLASLSDPRGR